MSNKVHDASCQVLAGILATILSLTGVGCGNSGDGFQRVPIKGKVTVDGQPLAAGVIRFLPDTSVAGRNSEAIVTNGEYALDEFTGPIAGKHRVEIEATYHIAYRIDDEAAYARHVQTQGAMLANPIPPQFNRQSQLTTDIPTAGSDNLNFNLPVKGAR